MLHCTTKRDDNEYSKRGTSVPVRARPSAGAPFKQFNSSYAIFEMVFCKSSKRSPETSAIEAQKLDSNSHQILFFAKFHQMHFV